jgi:hypothetical protein
VSSLYQFGREVYSDARSKYAAFSLVGRRFCVFSLAGSIVGSGFWFHIPSPSASERATCCKKEHPAPTPLALSMPDAFSSLLFLSLTESQSHHYSNRLFSDYAFNLVPLSICTYSYLPTFRAAIAPNGGKILSRITKCASVLVQVPLPNHRPDAQASSRSTSILVDHRKISESFTHRGTTHR